MKSDEEVIDQGFITIAEKPVEKGILKGKSIFDIMKNIYIRSITEYWGLYNKEHVNEKNIYRNCKSKINRFGNRV